MSKFGRAKPKPPAPDASNDPAPVPPRFAKAKDRPPVDIERAAAGDLRALLVLAGEVARWNCPDCPGIIREDGLALHHHACPYWQTHPDETPF